MRASYNMYSFSEEGELLQDLTTDPLIPGYMCSGSFMVKSGEIYATGAIELKNEWKTALEAFDGKKWSLIF